MLERPLKDEITHRDREDSHVAFAFTLRLLFLSVNIASGRTCLAYSMANTSKIRFEIVERVG